MRNIFDSTIVISCVILSSCVGEIDYFSSTSELGKLFEWENEFIGTLEKFKSNIEEKSISDDSVSLQQLKNYSLKFPQQFSSQLEGAFNGLLLLQDSFSLNISKFVDGEVVHRQSSEKSFFSHTRLEYEDIDSVAKAAYNRQFYHRAVEWFRAAADNAVKTKTREVAKIAKNLLKTSIKAHDKVLEQKGAEGIINGQAWRANPVPYDDKLRKKKKYKNVLKELKEQEKKSQFIFVRGHQHPILNDQFNRLCRGEKMRDESWFKHIKCLHHHSNNPYLRLGPFKLEDQSHDPYITVFRDFFSDHEMLHYKKYARSRLRRSEYGGKTFGDQQSSKQGVLRTSKQTWLEEYDGRTVNMSRRSIGPYVLRREVEAGAVDHVAMGLSMRVMRATGLFSTFQV